MKQTLTTLHTTPQTDSVRVSHSGDSMSNAELHAIQPARQLPAVHYNTEIPETLLRPNDSIFLPDIDTSVGRLDFRHHNTVVHLCEHLYQQPEIQAEGHLPIVVRHPRSRPRFPRKQYTHLVAAAYGRHLSGVGGTDGHQADRQECGICHYPARLSDVSGDTGRPDCIHIP